MTIRTNGQMKMTGCGPQGFQESNKDKSQSSSVSVSANQGVEMVFRVLELWLRILEVLPNVLLVLLSLLLFKQRDFILQLDNGSLNLVVFTDERHPV